MTHWPLVAAGRAAAPPPLPFHNQFEIRRETADRLADSTLRGVCRNLRSERHSVFKGVAHCGTSSTGGLDGFKRYDEKGCADKKLARNIKGGCVKT